MEESIKVGRRGDAVSLKNLNTGVCMFGVWVIGVRCLEGASWAVFFFCMEGLRGWWQCCLCAMALCYWIV